MRATPPTATTRSTATPLRAEALDDRATAEGGRLDEGGDTRRGASVPRLMPAIAPVRAWSASGVRRPLSQSIATTPDCTGSIFAASASRAGSSLASMASASPAARPARKGQAMMAPEPGEAVAESRLPCLVADHSLHDRAVDLAADSGHELLDLTPPRA